MFYIKQSDIINNQIRDIVFAIQNRNLIESDNIKQTDTNTKKIIILL